MFVGIIVVWWEGAKGESKQGKDVVYVLTQQQGKDVVYVPTQQQGKDVVYVPAQQQGRWRRRQTSPRL